jgi:hypothetical protein
MHHRTGVAALTAAALLAAAPAIAQQQPAASAAAPIDYVVVDAGLDEGTDLSKLPQGTIVEYEGLGCPGAIVTVRLRVAPAHLAEVQAFIERFAWKGHITKF